MCLENTGYLRRRSGMALSPNSHCISWTLTDKSYIVLDKKTAQAKAGLLKKKPAGFCRVVTRVVLQQVVKRVCFSLIPFPEKVSLQWFLIRMRRKTVLTMPNATSMAGSGLVDHMILNLKLQAGFTELSLP